MNEFNPVTWWRQLLALPNTSPFKSIVVVLIVSVACAIVVSVAAVTLRPKQQANLEAQRKARMAALLRSLPPARGAKPEAQLPVQTILVDLATGSIVKDRAAHTFDQRAAAADPQASIAIPKDADIAGIGRRAKLAAVHLVRRDTETTLIVLPVHGAGYQSMLYGYLALQPDLETVAALTFYEQAETPGLGDKVAAAQWLAKWPGTKLVDEEGKLRISVVKGAAARAYEVDGISGATRTGNGVNNLMRFWLGDLGFGPFLKRLAAGEVEP